MNRIRLGVNIDHVATLRNARGGPYPDPVRAAQMAMEAGADGITAHLREDRRHIRDEDIAGLAQKGIPLNLEMAATGEMVAIALKAKPKACCLVPERRAELTTEGGLDAAHTRVWLSPVVTKLRDAGIRVSLFIEPDPEQFDAAVSLGVPDVELHTGAYAEAVLSGDEAEIRARLQALADGAREAKRMGLEVHAGHGLTYDNVAAVAAIPEVEEVQIGHFLVGEAVFSGLGGAIARMRAILDGARA